MNRREASVAIYGEQHALRQLLASLFNQLAAVPCEPNPFASSAYRFDLHIAQVQEGSALLRYISGNLFGRPKLVVHVRVSDASRAIWEGRLSSRVFFEERVDVTFRGGLYGGADLPFMKTNCRRICEGVIIQLSTNLHLPAQTVKMLRKTTRRVALPKD